MSDAGTAPTPARNGTGIAIVALIAALLIGGLLLLVTTSGGARDRLLDNSPIGVRALGPWLDGAGIDTRASHRRLSPAVSSLSFRVYPLYDLNIFQRAADPETREERLEATTLRDISSTNLRAKIEEIPTLLLMPKWSGAMVETEIAHDQSLIPERMMGPLLAQIGLPGVAISRGGAEFLSAPTGLGQDVTLFHPQVFKPSTLPPRCRTEAEFGQDALVVSCPVAETEHRVYIASDPDIMNNHGLALGDNADFAVALLASFLAGDDRPVYIDRSPELLTSLDRADERQDYDRDMTEFKRFFEYPFTLFWAALLIILAVLFWRGAMRFGPILGAFGPSRDMSKGAAIAAKARLLRLSGNDGRIVSDFVRTQLQDLATRSLGRDIGQAGEQRFLALLARRDPDLARDFGAAARHLVDNAANLPPHQLQRALASYHSLLSKVVDHHGPV